MQGERQCSKRELANLSTASAALPPVKSGWKSFGESRAHNNLHMSFVIPLLEIFCPSKESPDRPKFLTAMTASAPFRLSFLLVASNGLDCVL